MTLQMPNQGEISENLSVYVNGEVRECRCEILDVRMLDFRY